MIITFTRTDRPIIKEKKYFTAYRWIKNNDTKILDYLWNIINNQDSNTSFEEIYDAINTAYDGTSIKSRVHIYKNDGDIEIVRKGVFPSILIEKKV